MMKKQKKPTAFSRGGWITLVCAALLAVVVLSGSVFDLLGTSSRIDMTSSGAFTLSQPTKDLLSGLQTDINIYAVLQDGSLDTRVTELLLRYEGASEKVQAQLITGEQAAYFTTAELEDNSLIVVGNGNTVVLEYAELYELQYEIDDYYQTLTDYSLAAEDKLNKAIENVTSDLPFAYLLSDHGEVAPESGLLDLLAQAGCHARNLYLAEVTEIPGDCAMIICNAPQADITEKEADALIGYLDAGGSFFLITEMQYGMGEQLARVMEHAGLAMQGGIIMEGDAEYMFGADYAYYLRPEYLSDHPLASSLFEGETEPVRVLAGVSHGITFTGEGEYEPRALLRTSDSAYIKPNAYLDGVIEYVDGDEYGPFTIAATSESASGGKVFWLASSQCLTDAIDEIVSGANYSAAGLVLGWMHENTVVSTLETVAPKSVMTPATTIAQPAAFIAVGAALPVALFIIGTILCVKRHKAKVSQKAE